MGSIGSENLKSVLEILNACYDSTTGGLKIAGTINGNFTITGNLTVNGNFTFGDAVTDVLTVTGVLRLADGTAASPSLSFTSDTDTGMYSPAANMIGFALGGALSIQFSAGYVYATGVVRLGANSLILAGAIADGATAIGVKIVNTIALVTAGAKIVSFYSDNTVTERAYIDYLGSFNAGPGTSALPSFSFVADPNTGFYNNAADSIVASCGGSTGFVVTAGLLQTAHLRTPSATAMLITGNVADGAAAVGVKLGNANALTTAGAIICGFYSDNVSTLKAYISKDGTFGSVLGAVTLGVGATTFAAAGNVMTITGDAGGNTIATITAGVTGQILVLKFVDALVTITDDATSAANTINLSAAFTSTANDVLTLMFDGTSWRELARSVN